jgi:hypothetical protein
MDTQYRLDKIRLDKIYCSSKMSDTDFDTFYGQYPKKVGKAKAKTVFKKLDKKILPNILKALAEQQTSEQWQNPKYIPHPSTWLNQKRWEDEGIKLTPEQDAKAMYAKYGDNAMFKFMDKYGEEETLKQKNILHL